MTLPVFAVFDTPEAFELWHADVNRALGYPTADGRTTAYTYLIPGAGGVYYAPINQDCPADALVGVVIAKAVEVKLDLAEGEMTYLGKDSQVLEVIAAAADEVLP